MSEGHAARTGRRSPRSDNQTMLIKLNMFNGQRQLLKSKTPNCHPAKPLFLLS